MTQAFSRRPITSGVRFDPRCWNFWCCYCCQMVNWFAFQRMLKRTSTVDRLWAIQEMWFVLVAYAWRLYDVTLHMCSAESTCASRVWARRSKLRSHWRGFWYVCLGDVNTSLQPGGATNVAHHLNGKVPYGRCPAANLAQISAPGVTMVQTPVVFPRCHRILVFWRHLQFVHQCCIIYTEVGGRNFLGNVVRVRLKPDSTRLRTGGEVKGKLANGVGSQYSSHYLGACCIQHYYRWCAHLGC